LKYFLYVSDTKLDMLFSQIPLKIRQKIAADLHINLGIIKADIRRKTEPNRYDKLKLVVQYIERNFDVGTIDDPKEYFKGMLPMRWGPISHNGLETLVYFGGKTDRTVFGLGGSLPHVIGEKVGGSVPKGGSLSFSILDALHRSLDTPSMDKLQRKTIGWPSVDSDLFEVMRATLNMRGTEESLEFFAKRLLEGTVEDWSTHTTSHVLLGTPLYVALTG
jgi:hypothetical protein